MTGTGQAEDVLGTAAGWLAEGERVALATVTETWGSSPRPSGSQMAVTLSGRMAGSVSGGCIEGAVAEAARRSIESGAPQLLDFGVTNERAWEVGLACGGKLKVFVERLGGPGEGDAIERRPPEHAETHTGVGGRSEERAR